jgi:predicted nuclease of predicted toxin-antitoxin system
MILLDECVPAKYRRFLESWGYEVTLLREISKPSDPDERVIELAQNLDAVLLTVDMDFANIVDYPPQNFAGIVVVRHQISDQLALEKSLKQAMADLYRDDLRGVLVVVTANRYRIRHGYP